ADAAGVSAASVCLRVAGETGACAHPGTAGASNSYSFSFPRPAAPQDGATAFNFTLEADDSLAATLTGASQAEHQQRTAQSVFFDYSGPIISVAADPTPYARTAVTIPVPAFIAESSRVLDSGALAHSP